MSPGSGQTPPPSRLAELALWGSAGLVVLAAHLGGALLLTRQTPTMAGDSAPPPAIMIEMAAEPEAVKVEETVVAPDQTTSEEVKSEEAEPVEEPAPQETPVPPETPPEPMPEPPPPEVQEPPPELPQEPQEVAEQPPEPTPEPVPEPVQEVPEPMPEPPPEPIPDTPEPPPEPIPEPPPEVVKEIEPVPAAPVLEDVEVPLPVMRPPPPPVEKKVEPKKQIKKPVAQKPKPRPPQASQRTEEAKAEVQQSNRNAASQSATGIAAPAVSTKAIDRWKSQAYSRLSSGAKRLNLSEFGTTTIRYMLDERGNVTTASVSKSSGSAVVDQAVLALVRRTSFPAPVPGLVQPIVVPVGVKGR